MKIVSFRFNKSMNNLTKSLFKRFTSSLTPPTSMSLFFNGHEFLLYLPFRYFCSPQWCKAEIMQEKGYFSTKKEEKEKRSSLRSLEWLLLLLFEWYFPLLIFILCIIFHTYDLLIQSRCQVWIGSFTFFTSNKKLLTLLKIFLLFRSTSILLHQFDFVCWLKTLTYREQKNQVWIFL